MYSFDYLVVGAGLFGSIFAYEATKRGKRVLVIDKREHLGGNIFTQNVEGIQVHVYGAHIFHTNNKEVWDYIQQFAEFNRFTNSPIAKYKNEMYNLPFNMNTFSRMWNLFTPDEVMAKINEQRSEIQSTPTNLEEQAISLVGRDIYEKLIKGYTEKQWGKKAKDLPAFIIKRLPVRMTYDNNYFDDKYQGIPIGGYTQIVEKMLAGIEVRLGVDFFQSRSELANCAKKILFTGMIDEFYEHCYGALQYRSLRFETEALDCENHQGNAVVNYTEYEIPYTRIIEHKHFDRQGILDSAKNKTIITKEYPMDYMPGAEPYYPINDEKNTELYAKYRALANKEKSVLFGGRLGMYRYFDMHHIIEEALHCVHGEMGR
jgi:UDP-galactopyranose mutase